VLSGDPIFPSCSPGRVKSATFSGWGSVPLFEKNSNFFFTILKKKERFFGALVLERLEYFRLYLASVEGSVGFLGKN